MSIINRFKQLDFYKKIAIFGTMIVLLLLGLTIWKQGVFLLGRTGSSGSLMPFLHHSRWGAIMAILGSFLILKRNSNGKNKIIGLWLIIIGIFLIIQHLATEQCFSVLQSLLTPEGKPIGGFC